jgi:hypothetical protein
MLNANLLSTGVAFAAGLVWGIRPTYIRLNRRSTRKTKTRKRLHMKILKAFLTTAVLMALAIGCSTTQQMENSLASAGFNMFPADTTGKKAQLNSLPANKITPVRREGTLYYTFPDPKNNVLYVGEERQYQLYRKIGLQKQMTDEQLNAAPLNNDGAWAFWGPWGGRSLALR